ncbi:MAG: flippase, partial [Candidatus Marinimicrobia bacterium]|nr:flippase [Candidatus Neomarinimicrobiota bacterium]
MSEISSSGTKIAREASISFSGQMLGQLLRYFFNVSVARFLGVYFLGIYAIGNALIQILLSIAKLGLDGGIVRFVADLRVTSDLPTLRATIFRAALVALAGGVVTAAVLFWQADFVASRIFHFEGPDLGDALRVMAWAIPLAAVATVCVSASQGFKVIKHRVVALNVLPAMVMIAAYYLFISFSRSTNTFTIPFLIAYGVSAIVAVMLLGRLVPLGIKPLVSPSPGLIRFSMPIMFTSVMGILLYMSDIVMLGYFKGTIATGLYQPAVRTAGFLGAFIVALNAINGPFMAEFHAQKQLSKIKQILKLGGKWGLALVWPSFLFLYLYASKVLLLFGADFLQARLILLVLAAGQVILALATGSATLLMMTGRQHLNLINSISVLAVNVVANIILIPKLGGLGAAYGSAIAMSLLTVMRLTE